MLQFTKMHGLGNDFVIIDAIHQDIKLSTGQIRFIADRHLGIGCDQLLLVEKPDTDSVADFKYRIFNADGSEVAQCGNGARCFARFVLEKKLTDKSEILVDTASRQLLLKTDADRQVTVNMGIPLHAPVDIPLLIETESKTYPLEIQGQTWQFGAVNIGNPHAVIIVPDIDNAPVRELGAIIERHALFPERVNVGFMQIVARNHIKLRVFERGSGETQACGSGACAAVIVGIEQQLLEPKVTVDLTGGALTIQWTGRNQPVFMTGPADHVFDGQIDL